MANPKQPSLREKLAIRDRELAAMKEQRDSYRAGLLVLYGDLKHEHESLGFTIDYLKEKLFPKPTRK